MDQTIIVSRTELYWIVLGLYDYFYSEIPVCSIIKPRASSRLFDCDSYWLHRFQIYKKTNITTDVLKYLYSRPSFLVCSPSWLYLVNCAVWNVQNCTQNRKLNIQKRGNQKDIIQNTMSHIGFRTGLIRVRIHGIHLIILYIVMN